MKIKNKTVRTALSDRTVIINCSGNGSTVNCYIQNSLRKCIFHQVKNKEEVVIIPKISRNGRKFDLKVEFSDLIQLEKLNDGAKNVLAEKKCEAQFQQVVKQYISKTGGEMYSLMATSLENSCKINKQADIDDNVKNIIQNVIDDNGKQKFCVFLSAITSIKGKNTIEYQAAKYINNALKKCNIGVFWWEDKELNDKNWFVSSKIATGLALSSIFVSLAYDSVKVRKNGKVDFTCFNGKISPCFKYENYTFRSFLTDRGNTSNCTTNGSQSKFDEFISGFDCGDNKDKFPTTRKIIVFSYGEPINHTGNNSFFDNLNQSVIATPIQSANDKEKIKLIFKSVISEIFRILRNDKEIESLCLNDNNKHYLQSEQSIDTLWKETDREVTRADYTDLYYPFGDVNHPEVKYCDGFLVGDKWKRNKKYPYMVEGSKENIEAVPSDFEFKYAIVDENGKNAKNHFLVFPERYYDVNGNIKWRMKLVVRDWNLRATVDDDYRKYLLSVDDNNDRKYLLKNDQPQPKEDSDFPLSQYSKIEFYKDKTDFSGKLDISFITEYATCQVYSDNTKEFDNGIATPSQNNHGVDNHCAFILNGDILDEVDPKYHLKGSLKLVSVSPKEVKPFYISVIFYPKSVVYNIKRGKSHKTQKMPCPYCGRKIGKGANCCDGHIVEIENKATNKTTKYATCTHNFIGDIYLLDETKTNITRSKGLGRNGVDYDEKVYGAFLNDIDTQCDEFIRYIERYSKTKLGRPVLEKNSKSRLVYNANYKNGAVVTMVGISQSGKSTFLSRMLSVHSDGDYKGNILCSYLKNAMKPYFQDVGLSHVKTVAMASTETNSDPWKHGINGVRLLEDYKSSKYSRFLSSTQNDESEPVLTHTPFTIEFTESSGNEKSFFSFFDLPGGLFAKASQSSPTLDKFNEDYTMLSNSDSIILLLSADSGQTDSLTTMMTAIENRIRSDAIVAVVFCKADQLFLNTQYEWTWLKRSSPVARDNKFNGSKRQAYIDKCSKEIQEQMSKSTASESLKDIINRLKKKFKDRCKFFAVSALGRGDSIVRGNNDTKYTLYETTPLNIENVLLWIMFERGIIE